MGNNQIIDYLVSLGANINAQTMDGRTPLFEACCATDEESKQVGRISTVSILLKYGANPLISDLSGNFSNYLEHHFIGHAIMDMKKVIHKLLRKMNDNISDIVDINLNFGCLFNNFEVFFNVYGVTPFHLACFSGNINICQLLLEKGANVNAQDKYMICLCLKEHQCIMLLVLLQKMLLSCYLIIMQIQM